MLKQEGSGGDTNSWARVCDTCHAAPCTVYCRADSAYLCTSCDARIHAANQVASRHERVWVCEACERAPAAFLCKADAASLCATCDAEIHSANPLARRHHRVPIMPVSGCMYGPPASDPSGRMSEDGFLGDETTDEGEEEEAASWLLINPPVAAGNKNSNIHSIGNNNGYGEEVDQYLDLFEYNSGADQHYCDPYKNQQQEFSVPEKSSGGDSVVPVQCGDGKDQQHIQYQNFLFGMECDIKSGYNYKPSLSHSVSVSSMDVGIVPDASAMSDISMSQPRPTKGTIDLFSSPAIQVPTQLSPMDREARVMRYREKKKNRKFEKTIRYASRKAYAETRPRIKGRFAKRTDIEAEADQMFPNGLIADAGYGIVPSF